MLHQNALEIISKTACCSLNDLGGTRRTYAPQPTTAFISREHFGDHQQDHLVITKLPTRRVGRITGCCLGGG
jgi:hypothetical protein